MANNPRAQSLRVFPVYFRFVFYFRFLICVLLFCLRFAFFYLRFLSFLFAFSFFVCVLLFLFAFSFFLIAFSFFYLRFLFCLRLSLLGHRTLPNQRSDKFYPRRIFSNPRSVVWLFNSPQHRKNCCSYKIGAKTGCALQLIYSPRKSYFA